MQKQQGFTLVEVLLIILVIGFLGFTGYYVWDRQSSKEGNQKAQPTKTTSSRGRVVTKSENETASWEKYETPDKLFSVKIPDGSTVEKTEEGLNILIENPVYVKGEPVRYRELLGRDGAKGLMITFNPQAIYDLDRSVYQESFQAYEGLTVKKYVFVQKSEPDGLDYSKGTTVYTYVVESVDGRQVGLSYSFVANPATELIDKIAKSVTIK